MIEFDEKSSHSQIIKTRIYLLGTFILATFFILLLRLFNLQIIKGFEYQERAKNVATRKIPIPTQRGEIYDRNNDMALVMNVETYAIDIIPAKVSKEEIDLLFTKLSKMLDMGKSEIQEKIPEESYLLFQPIELKSGVPFHTVSYIAEHYDEFEGVSWSVKLKRAYLETGSFSHIFGYVGDIDKEELQVLYNQGYGLDAVLGKTGIEKQYDLELRGKPGKRYRIVDVKEREVMGNSEKEDIPELGKHLVLTIDRYIQILCEKALGKHKGAVVVLKPYSGEVLALVSYPSFDPNIFYSKDYFTNLALDSDKPLINRALYTYPPASVFKIIMTAAILEEEAFPINKTVTCTGRIFFGDRYFHCWVRSGHGPLNLIQAFANSCNNYFQTMGRDYLGVETIVKYAYEFGLGKSTGIDIPGELDGFVPTPEWKEDKERIKWLGGDTMNLSIGQGYITVTPLQMANVVAMVVNQGIVYKPHLLKEIRDPLTGTVMSVKEKEILNRSTIKESTFNFIQRAMREVVLSGTAHYVVTTKAVEIAGKTGTSEIGIEKKEQKHEWFAGYAPYESSNPDERVIVVVVVEAVPFGEWWAPKIANYIFQGIFSDQSFEQVTATLGPLHPPQP